MILTLNGNELKKIETIPKILNATLEISFVNCNITEIQHGAFKNLQNLLALDMSANKLSSIIKLVIRSNRYTCYQQNNLNKYSYFNTLSIQSRLDFKSNNIFDTYFRQCIKRNNIQGAK